MAKTIRAAANYQTTADDLKKAKHRLGFVPIAQLFSEIVRRIAEGSETLKVQDMLDSIISRPVKRGRPPGVKEDRPRRRRTEGTPASLAT